MSLCRILSSRISFRNLNFSTLPFTSTYSADKIYDLLNKNGDNVDKTLAIVKPKLDSKCVIDVLEKFHPSQSKTGLRFFIWAGLQSDYRHTPFMYNKACKLFEVGRNPEIIYDVVEAYKSEKCFVTVKMFKIVLNLCKEAKLTDQAFWVLRKLPELGLRADTTMYNTVIRLFCLKGDMDTAESLLNELVLVELYPNMITYVEMIKGFCKAGRMDDALRLFGVLSEQGWEPNKVLYSVLLDGFCKIGNMETALGILEEMEKVGGESSPNVVTYTSIIQSFCEKGRTVEALKVLDRMEARGCFANRVTASCLLEQFCVEGRVEEAFELIDRVVNGGVSYEECYSSLVVSLKRNGQFEEAEKLFRKMIKGGLKPDGLSCSVVIKEICLIGRVLDGYQLCDEIEKIGFVSTIDSDVYSHLLVGLCEQGHSVEAAKLVRLMVNKGIPLRAPYAGKVVKIMKKIGDEGILRHLKRN